MVINKIISIDEFIQRIGMQPFGNIWSVLIIDTQNIEKVIEELRDTINIFAECEILIVSGINGVDELIEQVQDATEDYLILYQLNNWQERDWKKLDGYRSRLDKHKLGGLLVLSQAAAVQMVINAPNLSSWLGSKIYNLELDIELLNEEEKQLRLAALREWSNKTDQEIIALAEANKLPPDSEYGEWLILLDRGDLVER